MKYVLVLNTHEEDDLIAGVDEAAQLLEELLQGFSLAREKAWRVYPLSREMQA